MAKITGAQAVVKSLEREGVDIVFGVPGHHSMPIFDALYHHPRIKHMTVRHEQAAAFMADGYARASGEVAAVLCLPGPGVTNAYTGLGEAYTDSSPVLLLVTQVDRDHIDKNKGLLHELTGQYEIRFADEDRFIEVAFSGPAQAIEQLKQDRGQAVPFVALGSDDLLRRVTSASIQFRQLPLGVTAQPAKNTVSLEITAMQAAP